MNRTIITTLTLMVFAIAKANGMPIQQNDSIFMNMEDSTFMLDAVVVKAQRLKTKLTGNSMVTRIQGSVLEKSGTLKEMLAKVPGMTQKGDDLEVLGKGTPIYYINGRKMQEMDELKRLRSEEIKEVEVITNPGAQYDATLQAGLLACRSSSTNNHRLYVSLRYTFNAQKSKYKGTGAGQDAAGRMKK